MEQPPRRASIEDGSRGIRCYVVGLAVLFLSQFELVTAAFMVLRNKEQYEPWKNGEWRKLASKFLGSELSPPFEEPPPELVSAEASVVANAEGLSKSIKERHSRTQARLACQLSWPKWYEILRAYFPPNKPQYAFTNVYIAVFHSIGWAGIVSAYISGKHANWLVWFACILIVVFSHVFGIVNLQQEYNPDPLGNQLAAEMLKSIKSRGLEVR